jgi:hypothetical protein
MDSVRAAAASSALVCDVTAGLNLLVIRIGLPQVSAKQKSPRFLPRRNLGDFCFAET